MAAAFAHVSQSEHLPSTAAAYRAEEEKTFTTPLPDNSAPYNTPFTEAELHRAIQNITTSGKVIGHDPISYEMIRHIPKSLLTELLHFYQDCWVRSDQVDPIPGPLFPPWLQEKADITLTYSSSTKKYDPLLLTAIAQEKIDRDFHTHLQVFTDGSVTAGGLVGCAFFIPHLGITKRYRLNTGTSVFTTKMHAILMATSFLADLPIAPLSSYPYTFRLQVLASSSSTRRNPQQKCSTTENTAQPTPTEHHRSRHCSAVDPIPFRDPRK